MDVSIRLCLCCVCVHASMHTCPLVCCTGHSPCIHTHTHNHNHSSPPPPPPHHHQNHQNTPKKVEALRREVNSGLEEREALRADLAVARSVGAYELVCLFGSCVGVWPHLHTRPPNTLTHTYTHAHTPTHAPTIHTHTPTHPHPSTQTHRTRSGAWRACGRSCGRPRRRWTP